MAKKIKLSDEQIILKNELTNLYEQIWRYINSYGESISAVEAENLYLKMAQKAHELHMSLKVSGYNPKHHKYMIENRGCSPESIEFYEHVHPVQDLLAYIDDVHANDDPEDKTIDKTFIMRVYTRRWGHDDYYELKRTKKGWNIKFQGTVYSCDKSASKGLNKFLDHDGVCYPGKINIFFEWLWNKAADDGLSEKELQKAINKLGNWISVCEETLQEEYLRG